MEPNFNFLPPQGNPTKYSVLKPRMDLYPILISLFLFIQYNTLKDSNLMIFFVSFLKSKLSVYGIFHTLFLRLLLKISAVKPRYFFSPILKLQDFYHSFYIGLGQGNALWPVIFICILFLPFCLPQSLWHEVKCFSLFNCC